MAKTRRPPRTRSAPADVPAQRREAIYQLFCHGENDAAFMERLACCCRASRCGRLCNRLVKAPGAAKVYCVAVKTGTKTLLYRALADPDFACPEGRF